MKLFANIDAFRQEHGNEQRSSLTIGNFDGCHLGHQELFKKVKLAAEQSKLLAGALSFDPSAKVYFNPKAITQRLFTPQEKADFFARSGFDFLILQPFTKDIASMSHQDFVRKFILDGSRCQHLVVGYDFRFGADRKGDHDYLEEVSSQTDLQVEFASAARAADSQQVISSTLIRKSLVNGDLDTANKLLGRPYRLIGRVEHGQKLGRTLGFPTANLKLAEKLIPQIGVYACQVLIEGEPVRLAGVANIGRKPTVVIGGSVGCEVHVLDHVSLDLYGKSVALELIGRIRGEQKFAGLNQLKTQIDEDCRSARAILQRYSSE